MGCCVSKQRLMSGGSPTLCHPQTTGTPSWLRPRSRRPTATSSRQGSHWILRKVPVLDQESPLAISIRCCEHWFHSSSPVCAGAMITSQ